MWNAKITNENMVYYYLCDVYVMRLIKTIWLTVLNSYKMVSLFSYNLL